MQNATDILKQYWGFDSFRPLQEAIIESVLKGNDTVALLPTGGGKSVCFQVPAMLQEGICIVISPLIALMNDQVNKLQSQGIKAMALTGNISQNDLSTLLDNCKYGNYKFLYLSPERLQQEMVQQRLQHFKVNLIAIDEAHCISQWGNDFRPAYRNINILKELLPDVPFIALTATATSEVLEDTVQQLQLRNPAVFKKSFYRENLAYITVQENDKLYRLETLLKKNNHPVIIYTGYRQQTVDVSNYLNNKGYKSTFFHGGITAEEKKKRLKNWIQETTPIMVATNAFGMGIDKANVRMVIHMNIPDSIENYFQEAGRGGRDGELSRAILLHNNADIERTKNQNLNFLPTVATAKIVYEKLCHYFQIPYGEGEFTTHSFSFNTFCLHYDFNPLKTFNTIQALDRLGVIKLSQEFGRKTNIQFLLSSNAVLNYLETNSQRSIIAKTILRIYTGIFEQPTAINLELIQQKTGQSIEDIITVLKQMERDEVIDLELAHTDASITFVEPREDGRTINRIAKELEKQNRQKEKQLAAILRFVENNTVCKSVQLLNYFGETNATPCGLCNVCNTQKAVPTVAEIKLISEKILILLEQEPMTSRAVSENLTFTEEKIIYTLRQLMDVGKVKMNSKNEYFLD